MFTQIICPSAQNINSNPCIVKPDTDRIYIRVLSGTGTEYVLNVNEFNGGVNFIETFPNGASTTNTPTLEIYDANKVLLESVNSDVCSGFYPRTQMTFESGVT